MTNLVIAVTMNIVQNEGDLLKTVITSKEDILKHSKKFVQKNGCEAVNIRLIALECGVSVGSIYNYFNSKTQLVCSIIESIWNEIFFDEKYDFDNIIDFINWIYSRMEYGYKTYPKFFTLHSFAFMQNEREDGKKLMNQKWHYMLKDISNVVQKDKNIKDNAFNDKFTVQDFANVIFSFILSSILRHDYNPSSAIEVIKRTIYK